MKLLKALSIYTLVGVIGAGINFFVMPILSHYLLPTDYGLLAIFNTYITILIPLVSISAYSLLSVNYFRQKDKSIFASQFTSIQVIPLFTTIILAIITWSSYGRFADDLELSGTSVKWGYIILFITFLSIYYEQFISFLVFQNKAGLFAVYSLLKVAVEVGLTFYFIIVRGWNWEGRMYSWLITSVIFFIIGFIYFFRQGFIKLPIRFNYIKEGIVFGSPLVLHDVGKFVVNQSDRLFIVKMVPNGLYEAGIYNIGYTVGTLVLIIVNSYFKFYTPFLMERLTELSEERKLQIVKMGYFYFLGCIIMVVGILVFTPLFFRYFIDPLYSNGARYVFWVALGYCFWGGYMLFSGFIFFYKRNRILGWLAVFNVVTNALFNYFFIQWFGALGAAYATALSFLLLMLIVAWIAQRIIPLPWSQFGKVRSIKLG
jgi:O-antigen/teichoic acid export membrane protein